ncbi:HAD family phosphatase [Glaciihabitans sp. dw_435]|uniref:HAD family hydrolase n=1 Tax=Glaciihabitans sp. dw_435 TaxID=2720081 RepID=UPI0027DD95D0|nr:HAD family phosphatase [Glaciihabitans sp. dw_435]
MTTSPAAVLWDMDGTIIDTEPYWMDAETVLVESFGGTWTHEDALTLVGSGLWHSARLLQARGVTMSEGDIIDALTRTVLGRVGDALPWRPGARELLLELRSRGIKTALVTMSMRSLAEHVAASMGFEAFDVIVAGDDVAHSKPHPEPYLHAASLLDVSASDCVAIEDSAPGTASGVASGAVTIGVPLNSPLSADNGYTIWPTLADRTVDDLVDLFSSVRYPAKDSA